MTSEAKMESLTNFFTSLAESTQEEDSGPYESHFMPDAVMFIPNRPPLMGRAAIVGWFIKFREKLAIEIDNYKQEQIDVHGDIALVRSSSSGHYIVNSTGEHVAFVQKYLDVVLYNDEKWYLSYHVASSATFEPGLWNRDWESE